MSKILCSIILACAVGLFSLIGISINGFLGKKNKILDSVYGALFSIFCMIILLYLMPEVYGCLGFSYLYLFLVFLVIGYYIMKVFNKYYDLPKRVKRTKKDLIKTDIYVAVMIVITFSFYNLIVGAELYSTMLASLNEAVLQTIIASIKNFMIGFLFFYLLNQKDASRIKKVASVILFIITPLFGTVLMFLINKTSNALFMGCSFSMIIGMFLFILITEIIPNIRSCKNKNNTIKGIVVGALLIAISYII